MSSCCSIIEDPEDISRIISKYFIGLPVFHKSELGFCGFLSSHSLYYLQWLVIDILLKMWIFFFQSFEYIIQISSTSLVFCLKIQRRFFVDARIACDPNCLAPASISYGSLETGSDRCYRFWLTLFLIIFVTKPQTHQIKLYGEGGNH